MSDLPPQPLVPVPGPQPPLPLPPVPSGPRPRWPFVVAGCLLLSLLAVCGLIGLAGFGAMSFFDMMVETVPAQVRWADDGRLCVVQVPRQKGSLLVVWDKETERARSISDTSDSRSLVAVEPSAPVAWVAVGEKPPTPFDEGSRPTDVLRIDLRDSGRERSVTEGRWQPWPGRGAVAHLTVDKSKGALPSGLSIETSAAVTGKPVRLPDSVTTFEPLGWSPSGRYFALVPLDPQAIGSPPRLLIIDGVDGEVVMSVDDQAGSAFGSSADATWSWDEDTVAYLHGSVPTDERPPTFTLHEQGVRGVSKDLLRANGWTEPDTWQQDALLRLLGRDERGILVDDGLGGLWRVGPPDGPTRIRDLAPEHEFAEATAASPDGSVAAVAPQAVTGFGPPLYELLVDGKVVWNQEGKADGR